MKALETKTMETSAAEKRTVETKAEAAGKTVLIRVFGIVQGVGFRPTVKRHADRYQVTGNVCNKGPYVEILAGGDPENVDNFIGAVRNQPPKRAVILKMDVENIPESVSEGVLAGVPEAQPEMQSETQPEMQPGGAYTRIDKVEYKTGQQKERFEIIESEKEEGEIFVSPDIAVCPECKQELYDPKNRRYLHPFINCTCCGPRLTILNAMPYDRERTSMAGFPMCEECAYEYTHPETRRFDAQPVCCNDCGPEVYLLGRKERGADAIRTVRRLIKNGGIAAIKGIGGFHLCCDAANEEAVAKLRKRKRRPMKPFAVMMKDLETVRRECDLAAAGKRAEEILDGHQKPIILLPRKEGGRLCESVAPDNPKVGVMLPYAPVQLLLFDYKDDTEVSDCLVMTSANISDAPICRDDADALAELTGLCDVILSHNRNIRIRADDTVMDFYRGEPYMIRRSRGYAPLPFMTENDFHGEVLAVGGELKNTFCIGKNQLFYPSPYIGDMGDVRTVKALKDSVALMEELLETKPTVVACDMHPSYNTVSAAKEMGLPVFTVQHHYAHILSCMAENDRKDPVIGVSFDGTGYGTDGTIWGGEILICDYDGFKRWGCIEPFPQTGGDASAREGWRIAVSLLGKIYGREEAMPVIEALELCEPEKAKLQFMMEERKINTVTSTSAGRLFDAVSAILGIRRASTFEGEAATALQFAAQRALPLEKAAGAEIPGTSEPDIFDRKAPESPGEGAVYLPTFSLVKELTERRLAGQSPDVLSLFFHRELARMAAEACVQAGKETGIHTAALSGGVYQNTLLLDYTVKILEEKGFEVLTHHLLPPNDGGICLGQAVAAMQSIQKKRY